MKLIIFDMDQTLVDFVQLHNEVTHRMLKKFLESRLCSPRWITQAGARGTACAISPN